VRRPTAARHVGHARLRRSRTGPIASRRRRNGDVVATTTAGATATAITTDHSRVQR